MIFGHQKNLKIFSRYIAENRFPHGVLFAGLKNIGKRRVAIEIAKYLEDDHIENFFDFSQKDCFCRTCFLIEKGNFQDIIEIKEEGEIHIQKIREIRQRVSLSSFSRFKIVIINDVENLSPEAAGALLKTLEEPKGKTIFFLLSSKPNLLPRTIISRVEVFKFQPFSKEEIKNFLIKNSFLIEPAVIDLSFGRPGLARGLSIDKNKISYYNYLLKIIENIGMYSIPERFKTAKRIEEEGRLDDFIFLLEVWLRDLILLKNGVSKISLSFKKKEMEKKIVNLSESETKKEIREIQKIKNYLMFSNVNRLLAIENLMLNI